MNPYNKCTFNKTVNGEQLSIQFHVDNLKASHKDPAVLENLIKELQSVFEKEDKLMETTRKIHDYLGLQIIYSLPGKVVLSMFEYLEDIIMEVPVDLKLNNCNYPCNANLFQVDKTSPKLDPATADLFHQLVVRLLFAAK